MNHWHNELMAEFHRKDLVNDSKQIRLANLTSQSYLYRRGLFTQTMFNFANWMIATGKKLRKHYAIPAMSCNQASSSSSVC